jgi:hypothetical protein
MSFSVVLIENKHEKQLMLDFSFINIGSIFNIIFNKLRGKRLQCFESFVNFSEKDIWNGALNGFAYISFLRSKPLLDFYFPKYFINFQIFKLDV